MEISAEREGGAVIARANGRIDSSNSREFHSGLEAVVTDGDSAVVLNFEDVSYISSAGTESDPSCGQEPPERWYEICSLLNGRTNS